METYKKEVCYRWGNTDAYREHERKTKNYSKEKWAEAKDGLMAIFAAFANYKNDGLAVNSLEVQSLIVKLQEYITQNYYTCTNDILAGLGQMYVADKRFEKNINKHGEGIAEFASEAIAVYCQER